MHTAPGPCAYPLTASDLDGLDAGELREHAATYVASRGWDVYVDELVARIVRLIAKAGVGAIYVRAGIAADADLLDIEAR